MQRRLTTWTEVHAPVLALERWLQPTLSRMMALSLGSADRLAHQPLFNHQHLVDGVHAGAAQPS